MSGRAAARGPRVGLFGLLGAGNLGNDASVEAILQYLRTDHPGAVVDAMCTGWERMPARYGIAAVPFMWEQQRRLPGGVLGVGLRVLGRGIDIVRIAAWVRRHDVVIVPGMGIMEASLPINPWGVPFALFTMSASGRIFRTKVALVSAGATPAKHPMTARLFTSAAGLAAYRTFRDPDSREVLRKQGLDTSGDAIYPDLVFTVPAAPAAAIDPLSVGVGVMSYYGSNEDRERAQEIYASYVGKLKEFVRWLIDGGRSVQLFVGDECDQPVVDQIVSDIRERHPDIDPSRINGDPVTTFPELTQRLAPVALVVATRFHNVVFALKQGKPVISLGYSPKNTSLMEDVGLAEYCQDAWAIDVARLKTQFTDCEARSEQLRDKIKDIISERSQRSAEQFSELTRVLFPAGPAAPAAASQAPTRAARGD